MRPRFWSRVLPTFSCALFLLNAPLWADVLVLRSGCTIQGTLADREAFANDPRGRPEVAILLDVGTAAQPRLSRVPVDEIDFVVLETDGEKQVFDVRGESASLTTGAKPSSTSGARRFPYTEDPLTTAPAPKTSHRTEGGVALLLCGGAVTFIGAIADFDSPHTVAWQVGTVSSPGGVQYDGRNYALMAIGGVMMLAGLVLIAGPREPAPPTVGLRFAGEQPVLAYHCSF